MFRAKLQLEVDVIIQSSRKKSSLFGLRKSNESEYFQTEKTFSIDESISKCLDEVNSSLLRYQLFDSEEAFTSYIDLVKCSLSNFIGKTDLHRIITIHGGFIFSNSAPYIGELCEKSPCRYRVKIVDKQDIEDLTINELKQTLKSSDYIKALNALGANIVSNF